MQKAENILATEIVDACFRIHTRIGPGLLESVYEELLAYELDQRDIPCRRQQQISLTYDGKIFERHFLLTLL